MINKKDFCKLTSKDIPGEIKEREKLIQQMVGWLYPSILQDEIECLKERYLKLTGKEYT